MPRRYALMMAVVAGLAGLAAAAVARRQFGAPMSPPAQAVCRFPDGKTITVDYSSPRVRGRKIFGALVPYGRVWILGANEATSFDTTANLTAAGKSIPAGHYTLFAIPEPRAWTLIVSQARRSQLGSMSYYPGRGRDFARLPLAVSALSAPLEDFTISFTPATTPAGASCALRFAWARTQATLAVAEAN